MKNIISILIDSIELIHYSKKLEKTTNQVQEQANTLDYRNEFSLNEYKEGKNEQHIILNHFYKMISSDIKEDYDALNSILNSDFKFMNFALSHSKKRLLKADKLFNFIENKKTKQSQNINSLATA